MAQEEWTNSIERHLRAARQRLESVDAAHAEQRDNDRWQGLRELLNWLHALDDIGKAQTGERAWFDLRSSSAGGRTFAALVWVRGLTQHHQAEVERLRWLPTS